MSLIADSGGLVDAASQVDGSAHALADIDVAGPFATASDALPGSRTSQACLWVSTRTAAAVQVYAERLTSLASSARTTARDLTDTDAGVAGSYGRVPR